MYGSTVAVSVLAIVLLVAAALLTLLLLLLLLLFVFMRLHMKHDGCAGAPFTLVMTIIIDNHWKDVFYIRYLENLYWEVAELERSFAAATAGMHTGQICRNTQVKYAGKRRNYKRD